MSTGTIPRYLPLRGLAIALGILLLGALVATVAVCITLVLRIRSFDAYEEARTIRSALNVLSADDAVTSAWACLVLILVAVLVVLIVFLNRAARNTELWSRTPARWATGWTIGGWFIPLANLVIPLFVVRDVWLRTDAADTGGPLRERGHALLVAWWLLLVTGVGAVVLFPSGRSVDQFRRHDVALLAGLGAWAIAWILLIVIVRGLARHQETARSEASGTRP